MKAVGDREKRYILLAMEKGLVEQFYLCLHSQDWKSIDYAILYYSLPFPDNTRLLYLPQTESYFYGSPSDVESSIIRHICELVERRTGVSYNSPILRVTKKHMLFQRDRSLVLTDILNEVLNRERKSKHGYLPYSHSDCNRAAGESYESCENR